MKTNYLTLNGILILANMHGNVLAGGGESVTPDNELNPKTPPHVSHVIDAPEAASTTAPLSTQTSVSTEQNGTPIKEGIYADFYNQIKNIKSSATIESILDNPMKRGEKIITLKNVDSDFREKIMQQLWHREKEYEVLQLKGHQLERVEFSGGRDGISVKLIWSIVF